MHERSHPTTRPTAHPTTTTHHLDEAVEVPLVVRADRAVVRQPLHHVQLLERDLVDLVDRVDRRHVDPAPLDDIDQVVDVVVAAEVDVRVADAVL